MGQRTGNPPHNHSRQRYQSDCQRRDEDAEREMRRLMNCRNLAQRGFTGSFIRNTLNPPMEAR